MTSPHQEPPAPLDPRVGLAAERTLLAWVRTGLALMGFGFVVARFGLFLHELAATRQAAPAHGTGLSLWIGIGLVVMGVVVNVAAAVKHVRLVRRLERGGPYRAGVWSLGVVVILTLAVIGSVMTAYLFFWGH